MNSRSNGPPFQLFYGASDADEPFVAQMEKALALLRTKGHICEWSRPQIVPGQSKTDVAANKMAQANILVFLLSPDFLNSPECMEMWENAGQLSEADPDVFRVPIIIRDCPWDDLFGGDDPMPLPKSGQAIINFENSDAAWLEVYEGVSQIVETLRSAAVPTIDFMAAISEIDIPSLRNVALQDTFIFPNLSDQKIPERRERHYSTPIRNPQDLLTTKHVIIHGPDQSGKTALARFLYLQLASDNQPVLLVDHVPNRRINTTVFKREYENQYHGDFNDWVQKADKTVIIDGIHPGRQGSDLLNAARDIFDRIVLVIPSDLYYSMYFDDVDVAEFRVVAIEPLTSSQQEQLIRRRMALTTGDDPVADGDVDQIEQRVNEIIVSNKVVPRYPFYVLSILESFDAFTPGSLPITSFGHCYYALMVSRFVHAGISSDDAMNTCFNFLEELAFATYVSDTHQHETKLDFPDFVAQYRRSFLINEAILNRLTNAEFGVIDHEGKFRTDYMFYFMLGKHLAKRQNEHYDIIAELCDNSHREKNFLIILFTIHHTTDNEIIDDILLRTMVTFDQRRPAELSKMETRTFGRILAELPVSILGEDSVAEARARARDVHDQLVEFDRDGVDDDQAPREPEPVVNMLRIYRNSRIMSQVLRTKHGNVTITKLDEIVDTIAEAGLRLVALSLMDERQINRLRVAVQVQLREMGVDEAEIDDEKVLLGIEYLTLLFVLLNVQQIVSCVNIPEIAEILDGVVKRHDNAAYDLIGYCSMLESASRLTWRERDALDHILKKHDDLLVQRIASFATQAYMGTHASDAQVEQSVCALLGIRYVARPRMSR